MPLMYNMGMIDDKKLRKSSDVHGHFNYGGVFDHQVARIQQDRFAHFVEIGSYLGKSTCYLADLILNSGKDIRLDLVDRWDMIYHDSVPFVNSQAMSKSERYQSYYACLENIFQYAKYIKIFPIRMLSIDAATLYEDNSLDFVFIDADHDFSNVMDDLSAWYPKVKPGGTIAGHDYDNKWGKKWGGLKDGVDYFFSKLGLKITECNPKDRDPDSWMLIKPWTLINP